MSTDRTPRCGCVIKKLHDGDVASLLSRFVIIVDTRSAARETLAFPWTGIRRGWVGVLRRPARDREEERCDEKKNSDTRNKEELVFIFR